MKQFEDTIKSVGGFGIYQRLHLIILWVITGSTAFFQMGNTFYSASADHYCKVYDNQTYVDQSSLKNCTIPYSLGGGDISWDKCQRYDVNVSQGISDEVCSPRSEETINCDQGWVYDKTWYDSTVVFEYNLVCDNGWMRQLSKSIVPLGNLVGVIIFGQLSDIFGRRPIFFITLVLAIVTGVLTSFAQTYAMFVIGQFLLGALPHSLFVTGNVLILEIVSLEYRTMCNAVLHVGFSVCYMLFGVIALLCHGNWRLIQLIAGLSWILFLPSFFFITESPMWLIQKHKYGKAEKVLQTFAKFNKKTLLPGNIFQEDKEAHDKSPAVESEIKERQHTLVDIFRTPRLRFRALIMCFNWFACSFVYYGISLNTDQIGNNPYTTFILAGLVEIPGRLLAWGLLQVIGRRWSLCGFAFVGGLALILSVPPEIEEVSVAIAMVAKLCIAATFTIVYLYAAEIYPTVVRNAGMGMSSMSARVGSIISPYVMLLDVIWAPMPFVVMGVTSMISGLLALLLPETKNKKLPETLREGEFFGTSKAVSLEGESELEDKITNDAHELKPSKLSEAEETSDKTEKSTELGTVNEAYQ
ncbi:organic cation transporter protein-like [Ptychodera flava]|uniref:organic cation transporter protein-like n=1 Tax=Ptychodera flava TaxID=63121 RepID=UPI00396A6ABF